MLVGYIRALPGLSAASQRTALARAACQKVHEDLASETRPFAERDRMLDHLWTGDILVVARLACLADTLPMLLDVGQRLFDREAGLISRAEPWADTTSATGASILAALNGLAVLGLQAAPASVAPKRGEATPAQGSKVGRPSKISARQWDQYGDQVLSGQLTVPAAARLMGCGRATLYRHLASIRDAGSH
jgi:DNA invertase Pin-like site-specific DNA recombinase